MRIRDLTRQRGEAVLSAWPPRVWTSTGSVFTPGHLGVLKSVQRIRDREFGDWLAVVAVHEGQEHHGAFRCDECQTEADLHPQGWSSSKSRATPKCWKLIARACPEGR